MDLGLGGAGSDYGDEPPQDEQAILSYVESKLDEARRTANRTAHESVWLTNSAHLIGYTHLFWDSAMRSFRNTATDGEPLKYQTNRLLPLVQNRTARLCKSPPKYEVRPNSMESEDKDAASLGKEVINQVWDQQKINRKRIDLTMWKQQCGHSYLKVSWDGSVGETMTDPLTGQSTKQGDIRVDITPAFEVYPDPAAKTMDELAWLIQTKIRPLSYFRAHYGEKGALVKEEQTNILGLQYQTRINTLTTKSDGDGTNQTLKNTAIEKAYYEAPTDKHPEGRMIIAAGGVLLEDKPLAVGAIPFVKFDDIVVGGKFYSEAIVTQLRPIQTQINRLVNQRVKWTQSLLAGKYSVARGAGIHQEALDDQSGEVLEYDPVPQAPDGGRPMAIQVPMIPQWAYTEEDRMVASMNDIAGIGDISQGKSTSASMPALGMQILQEADATRLGVVIEADEHSWAQVGNLILKFAQKFYTEKRLLKVSNGSSYLVKSFTGADLRGNTDVIVVPGSTQPNSLTLKRQDIFNLLQAGLLGPMGDPATMEKALNMMQYGDLAEVWKTTSLKEAQIKKVIEQIEMGIPVQITEFDDAREWFLKLNDYRISDKFQKLDPYKQHTLVALMDQCVVMQMPSGLQAPPAPIPGDVGTEPPMGASTPAELELAGTGL